MTWHRRVLFFIDAATVRKQALLLEEVQKINRENAERSISPKGSETEESLSQNLLDFILEQDKVPEVEHEELLPDSQESGAELKEEEEEVDGAKAEDIQDEADEMVIRCEEEIKEALEEESREEDSAMVDVEVDENAATPQRYPV